MRRRLYRFICEGTVYFCFSLTMEKSFHYKLEFRELAKHRSFPERVGSREKQEMLLTSSHISVYRCKKLRVGSTSRYEIGRLVQFTELCNLSGRILAIKACPWMVQ